MTGAEAKLLFYGLSSDKIDAPAYFTHAQVEAWMRQSLNDIAERTRFLLKNYTSVLPASNTLGLGTDLINLRRFETDDGGRMYPITTRTLERNNRDWRSLTGYPKYYYMDNQQANPGSLVLALYPLQSANTTYTIYYEAYPQDFIDGAVSDIDDEMEIPKWCAHAVVYGALSKAFLSEGYRQNLRAAAFYGRMYESLVERLRVRANSRIPKTWVHGRPAARRVRVSEKLPRNIPES